MSVQVCFGGLMLGIGWLAVRAAVAMVMCDRHFTVPMSQDGKVGLLVVNHGKTTWLQLER